MGQSRLVPFESVYKFVQIWDKVGWFLSIFAPPHHVGACDEQQRQKRPQHHRHQSVVEALERVRGGGVDEPSERGDVRYRRSRGGDDPTGGVADDLPGP